MTQASRNIRERKYNKNSKYEFSNRFGLLFFIAVLVVIGICGWAITRWMDDSDHLPLSLLVISGHRQLTRDNDIREVIMSLGEPKTFITQDVDEIQKHIMANLPWIRQVSVRKQWPDILKIHVTEFEPYAFYNSSELLDKDGHIFQAPVSRIQDKSYPHLFSGKGSEKILLKGFDEMKPFLAKHGFEIKSVVLNDRYAWQILLTNGIRLELGRRDRMLRLGRFVTIYSTLLQQSNEQPNINYIDLRYGTGAAVSFSSQ